MKHNYPPHDPFSYYYTYPLVDFPTNEKENDRLLPLLCPICRCITRDEDDGEIIRFDIIGSRLLLLPFHAYAVVDKSLKNLINNPYSSSSSTSYSSSSSVSTALKDLQRDSPHLSKQDIELVQTKMNQFQKEMMEKKSAFVQTTTNYVEEWLQNVDLSCKYCKIKYLSYADIKHIFICPKREFICGFTDCLQIFTWTKAFDKYILKKKARPFTENQYLDILNHAFMDHIRSGNCKHKSMCPDVNCPWYDKLLLVTEMNRHIRLHDTINSYKNEILILNNLNQKYMVGKLINLEQIKCHIMVLHALSLSYFNNNNNNNNNNNPHDLKSWILVMDKIFTHELQHNSHEISLTFYEMWRSLLPIINELTILYQQK